ERLVGGAARPLLVVRFVQGNEDRVHRHHPVRHGDGEPRHLRSTRFGELDAIEDRLQRQVRTVCRNENMLEHRSSRYRAPPHPLAPTERRTTRSTTAPIAASMTMPWRPPQIWRLRRGRSHSPTSAPTIPIAASPASPKPLPRSALPISHPATAPTTRMTIMRSLVRCTNFPPPESRSSTRLTRRDSRRARPSQLRRRRSGAKFRPTGPSQSDFRPPQNLPRS